MPSALRRGRSAVRDAAAAEDLTCPICMELPEAEVLKCSNNHKFCASCLTMHLGQSTTCPSCRTAIDEPQRDLDTERRIGRLPASCEGCGAGMLRTALTVHKGTCGDVMVECPFPGCVERMPRRLLAAHLADPITAQIHIQLAQSLSTRLQKCENIVAEMPVHAEIAVYNTRDVESGDFDEPHTVDRIVLSMMEPINDQLVDFCEENELERAQCTVRGGERLTLLDTSQSPFQLGVDLVSDIIIATDTVPDAATRRAEREEREAHTLTAALRAAHAWHQDDGNSLNIKVMAQDGTEVFFKMRPTTPFKKLFDAYCNRQGLPRSAVHWLFDGGRIQEDETPSDLEMEDGDTVDAVGSR